jgi:hypothetical protein
MNTKVEVDIDDVLRIPSIKNKQDYKMLFGSQRSSLVSQDSSRERNMTESKLRRHFETKYFINTSKRYPPVNQVKANNKLDHIRNSSLLTTNALDDSLYGGVGPSISIG